MKRIILGLGVLLMLAQNGFAYTDAEFDLVIAKTSGYLQQNLKCEKATKNYLKSGDIQEWSGNLNSYKEFKQF